MKSTPLMQLKLLGNDEEGENCCVLYCFNWVVMPCVGYFKGVIIDCVDCLNGGRNRLCLLLQWDLNSLCWLNMSAGLLNTSLSKLSLNLLILLL